MARGTGWLFRSVGLRGCDSRKKQSQEEPGRWSQQTPHTGQMPLHLECVRLTDWYVGSTS